jgi:hypothetical protein
MDQLAMLVTLLFGFVLGFYLYEVKRYKVGGVIAIPVLVIYSMQDLIVLPIFVVATALCIVFAGFVAEKTLLYGRRLLYTYLAISIVATSLITYAVSTVMGLSLSELVIFTIFPGIIAYNISKESYDVNSAGESVFLVAVNFALVYAFAFGVQALI